MFGRCFSSVDASKLASSTKSTEKLVISAAKKNLKQSPWKMRFLVMLVIYYNGDDD